MGPRLISLCRQPFGEFFAMRSKSWFHLISFKSLDHVSADMALPIVEESICLRFFAAAFSRCSRIAIRRSSSGRSPCGSGAAIDHAAAAMGLERGNQ